MASALAVGIDGGGTATRACVIDQRGDPLAYGEAGPALAEVWGSRLDLAAVATAVERAAAAAGTSLPFAALCAGLAGAGRESERAVARRELMSRGLAAQALVVTDAEAAFYDAFADGPGLLLIAGTGSIAWGRSEDGRQARVGGWGARLGDEGSAYDIAIQALRAAARAADGRGEETELLPRLSEVLRLAEPGTLITWAAAAGKRDVAALAASVFAARAAGDGVASRIVQDAVLELQRHVEALLLRLGPWSTAPGLALAGALLGPGGPLRDEIVEALAARACVLRLDPVDAARGAARLALRSLRAPG
ncbi:MAG: BadF/BadG/BcrA/BcrD type ATPase [Gemmatimonadota bacterium]|nr:MAG: BadF/BadG/BcrA/BcrD type ATPase [Gemmatimonadota bacterium]